MKRMRYEKSFGYCCEGIEKFIEAENQSNDVKSQAPFPRDDIIKNGRKQLRSIAANIIIEYLFEKSISSPHYMVVEV